MKLYHGTARALGALIELEGLDPAGPFKDFPFKEMLTHDGKSSYSIPSYVYFYEDEKLAEYFGCGSAEKVGLGNQAQVFEIDTGEVKMVPDPKLPRSWMHKGKIPAKLLKSVGVVDCEKLKKIL